MFKLSNNLRAAGLAAVAAAGALVFTGASPVSADAGDPSLTACEDGLAVLGEDGLDADRSWILLSGGIHTGTEDNTQAIVDPLTVPLLGLNTTELVHDLNCEAVGPVEDVVDEITVPLVQNLGLKGALAPLRALFGN